MACRLLPLDKDPGLRPIGIGEVLRRILGKAVTSVLRGDLQDCAGSQQLCVGQDGGVEANIHGLKAIFEEEETHGVIQVDARNAFNTINRKVLLKNIICPEISVYASNCYAKPARLFVTGGMEIPSAEGTTQGDPIAMPIYVLGILPLMSTLDPISQGSIKQTAFADDLTGAGSVESLKQWWDGIVAIGPLLGYYPEPTKSWLIVKHPHLEIANAVFVDTGINITDEGRKHLGAVIGTDNFKTLYVNEQIDIWINELTKLSDIAKVEPHAAYSAFTHGYRHKFTYVMRTVDGVNNLFTRLDRAIDKLIQNLFFGHELSEEERKIVYLPVRIGGGGGEGG